MFDACFTNDEDFALVGGKVEDPRNVDGRTVRRREDFFLFLFFLSACLLPSHVYISCHPRISYRRAWDSQCFQLLLVIRARLGAVVRNENHLLSCMTVPISLVHALVSIVACIYRSSSAIRASQLCRGKDGLQTIKLLVRHYQSCPCV